MNAATAVITFGWLVALITLALTLAALVSDGNTGGVVLTGLAWIAVLAGALTYVVFR